ncbi:hypothetical protein DFP72DRAFT_840715 [Ephemerocybe angulata]|uniref:Uncharacterized protein n=1 Tax=Ephemerocybe angulata TaxID=980116 RepID=A0A8H6IDI4_9AGAR|nr:hypothetical protein DFP72DRAFT_840715 [Tulosesus angulatus]
MYARYGSSNVVFQFCRVRDPLYPWWDSLRYKVETLKAMAIDGRKAENRCEWPSDDTELSTAAGHSVAGMVQGGGRTQFGDCEIIGSNPPSSGTTTGNRPFRLLFPA